MASKNKKKACRLNYTKESISFALQEIAKGKGINETARKFCIPESTLRSKKLNLYADKKPGPAPVLNEEEENLLVQLIFHCCNKGFPVKPNQLIENVKMICQKLKRNNPFKNNTPGRVWYEGFKRRHPEIVKRTSESVNLSRAKVTEWSLRKWFAEVSTFLSEECLIHIEPDRIFNCDETGLSLNPSSSTVLAPKGHKNVYQITGNDEKKAITALVTSNALGHLAPTLVLLAGKSIPKNVVDMAPEDSAFRFSENGWMLAQNFYEYVANIFEPWLTEKKVKRPVIFYTDGHSSHMTLHLSEFCSTHGIILIALHPNATHIIQPLDVSFFRALKVKWTKVCENFNKNNLCIGVKKHQFAPLLQQIYASLNVQKIVQNGLKRCGLYPFDENSVDYSKVMRNQQHANTFEENTKDDSPNISLENFEKFLNPDQIKLFKSNVGPTWKGALQNDALFNIWYKLSNSTNDVFENNKKNEEVLSELNSQEITANVMYNAAADLNVGNEEQSSNNIHVQSTFDFQHIQMNKCNERNECVLLELEVDNFSNINVNQNCNINLEDCKPLTVTNDIVILETNNTEFSKDLESNFITLSNDLENNSSQLVHDEEKNLMHLPTDFKVKKFVEIDELPQSHDSVLEVPPDFLNKVKCATSTSHLAEDNSILKRNQEEDIHTINKPYVYENKSTSDIFDVNSEPDAKLVKTPFNDIKNLNETSATEEIKKYLFWPGENLLKTTKSKRKFTDEKKPSILTDSKWLNIMKEKEKIKRIKVEEANDRRKIKLEKQETLKVGKQNAQIKKEAEKKKKAEEKRMKEKQTLEKQKEKLQKQIKKLQEIEERNNANKLQLFSNNEEEKLSTPLQN